MHLFRKPSSDELVGIDGSGQALRAFVSAHLSSRWRSCASSSPFGKCLAQLLRQRNNANVSGNLATALTDRARAKHLGILRRVALATDKAVGKSANFPLFLARKLRLSCALPIDVLRSKKEHDSPQARLYDDALVTFCLDGPDWLPIVER